MQRKTAERQEKWRQEKCSKKKPPAERNASPSKNGMELANIIKKKTLQRQQEEDGMDTAVFEKAMEVFETPQEFWEERCV